MARSRIPWGLARCHLALPPKVMLRTPLLAVLFAAPSFAAPQDFELAADINALGSTPIAGFPVQNLLSGDPVLGSGALYRGLNIFKGLEPYWAAIDQPIVSLGDLYPGPGSSNAASSVMYAGKAYFQAYTPKLGAEIWVTDGTKLGTHLWADLGPQGETVNAKPHLAVPGGFLFSALSSSGETELFLTDGNPAVQVQLTDMAPSDGDHEMGPFYQSKNGLIYFQNRSSANGVEIWVTDGTAGGTHILYDIASGNKGLDVTEFLDFGGLTYISLRNFASVRSELWSTDGTAAGTQFVMDIGGTFTSWGELVEFGGKLAFTASTGPTGPQIWVLGGAFSVPVPATKIKMGLIPIELTPLGDQLLFTLTPNFSSAELWTLSASPNSEQILTDINPNGGSSPRHLIELNGRVYFVAYEPIHGLELWSTDGTTAGTQLVSDIYPGPDYSSPSDFVVVPGGLLFTAKGATVGRELFQLSNGVVSLHTDLEPAFYTWDSDPKEITTVFARDLYMSADSTVVLGHEPHAFLAAGGIVALGDLYPFNDSLSADFTGIVQSGQKRVLFSAKTSFATRDLIVSDGTAAGTNALGLSGSVLGSDPIGLQAYRDAFYFVAEALGGELELWRTDGTLAGTAQVTTSGPNGASNPGDLVVAGPYLYFTAIDAAGYRNLFQTDGATTTQITSQTTAVTNGVEQIANVRGRVVYALHSPVGVALVVHDPVTGGETSFPLDPSFNIPTNQLDDPLYAPTTHGSRYYFFAEDLVFGKGYRSLDVDTGVVTILSSTVAGGPFSPNTGHSLRFIGAQGYFVGDGSKGVELYRLTNAPLSAQLFYNLLGIDPSTGTEGSSMPSELVAAGNDLYFYIQETDIPGLINDVLTTNGGPITTACEITDSTATKNPPDSLTLANGTLYFTTDLIHAYGSELYRRPEIGAHVVDFGTDGSGGLLEIDAPIMNTNCGVYLRNQAPGTVTTLWFSGVNSGVASDPATGLTVPGDALWLNPLTASFSGFATSTDFLKAIPIPSATQLINKSFIVQGVMVDPLNPATLRTTNAKLVTLGF